LVTEFQQDISAEKTVAAIKKVDFKMISFTLAGKDYGVDIMKVKEIRKSGVFTHVPNTPVYVRGVDNLRGDIIPIIDLRIMFNLPAERLEEGSLENIIILRLGELVLGIIVDTIEKVVGISKDSIQAPHPIFGDINVKYISGVVENDNRLYIILDVDRIFVREKEEKATPEKTEPLKPLEHTLPKEPETLDLQFLSETLTTFADFYSSPLNEDWVKSRAAQWKNERSTRHLEVQLGGKDDANEFLSTFYSERTDALWDWNSSKNWISKLDLGNQGLIMVWNPGCGKGKESYSLSVLLKDCFPDRQLKIWSNDKDLLGISMAPSLVFREQDIPEEYKSSMVETKNGFQFTSEVKSRILFEFHDIVHINPYTDLHFIVSRDILSFLKPHEQENLLIEFHEKLRPGGYLLLGKNEKIVQDGMWECVNTEGVSLFRKL